MAQQVKKNVNNSTKNENTKPENDFIEKDKEIESLKKSNQEKDEEIKNLKNDFNDLKSKLDLILSSGGLLSHKSNEESEDIKVGYRGVYGGALANATGSLTYKFESNEEKYIDSEDLKQLFKESGLRNNKKMFEDDIFYFVDEKNYSKFKIKKRVDLSKENILRILTLDDVNDTIIELNKMTNTKLDFNVLHAFQYQVARLIIDKNAKLKDWKYENRTALERYINQKFDDLLAGMGAIEILGRTKFKN